jgi:hypothetical protein
VVEGELAVTPATRRPAKTILGVAGQLIIRVAGNGLYEVLKQFVA